MIEFVDALDNFGEQWLNGAKTRRTLGAFLGNAKHFGLGFVQQLARLPALRIEGGLGNLVSHGDKLAQHGALAHDLRIAPDVGSRRRVVRQCVEVTQPAGLLCLGNAGERFVHRHDIGRTRKIDQARNVLPDQLVIMAIEVIFTDHVGDAFPGRVVEQKTAQNGLFRLNRMGRNTKVI